MSMKALPAQNETLPVEALPLSQQTMRHEGHEPDKVAVQTDNNKNYQDPYMDLGALGVGGMGEVRQVLDPALGRVLARKMIRNDKPHPVILNRFIAEARLTARLEHPGIVPVHTFGVLSDGRPYFTMKQIKGMSLDQLLATSTAGDPSTLPRFINILIRICEAAGYAHSQGVVHRDIKPANIMVGDFGEVLLLDWGIARILAEDIEAEEPSSVHLSDLHSGSTGYGMVMGTATYMPIEQAQGNLDLIQPPTDVYALGAILYEILTGRPPYTGSDPYQILATLLKESPPDLESVVSWSIPKELADICRKAIARNLEDRYEDASALGRALEAWRDGDLRRQEALRLVQEALKMRPVVEQLRQEAHNLRAQATQMSNSLQVYDPVEKKLPVWALEDRAEAVAQRSALQEIELTRTLGAALSQAPDLREAHDMLADLYHDWHAEAEGRQDISAALRYEALLKAHDHGKYRAYLDGMGTFTLHTDPVGARVKVYQYTLQERRLLPVYLKEIGSTPLENIPLPHGSYLLEISHPECVTVRYPVLIGRGEHWSGIRPDETVPYPIALPRSLTPEDCYVPAGWALIGKSNPNRNELPSMRIWVDGFTIRRYPVTNREYLVFLNSLVDQGNEADALRYQPLQNANNGHQDPNVYAIYGRDADGHFFLKPDNEGDLWDPEWPVLLIDWHSASAYAAWETKRTGIHWRLPSEIEREKAGRGADGRSYPWGNYAEPTWCQNLHSQKARPKPAKVSDYPIDSSVYGVAGLAGNCRDWCMEAKSERKILNDTRYLVENLDAKTDDVWRWCRGGIWSATVNYGTLNARFPVPQNHRYSIIGFRLASDQL